MADFNKPKKPETNAPKPSASPTPSPKPTAPSSPAPKFNSGPSPKPTAPKQAITPNQVPKTTPKLNGGTNPKPTAPKVDPVRQKIMSQGFAPNKQNTNNASKNIWDRYNKLNDNQKKDFALNVYNYGTNDFDNPIGKFRDPGTGEVFYGDSSSNYEDRSDYLLGRDEDSRSQLNSAVEDLINSGLNDDDIEKLFNEREVQEISDYRGNDDNDNKSEEEEWNNEDNPGSAVVSGRLMDYVRRKLSEDPELSPQFIDKMVKGLYNDSNQADYYKGKMKEDWERRKASKLYGTDLKEKKSFWPRDKNYQEPEGFKFEEWANADLKQKSDEDLVKMHDNLSKKLWHLQHRSPEEDALQSKIEREYLRRHPVNLDDE